MTESDSPESGTKQSVRTLAELEIGGGWVVKSVKGNIYLGIRDELDGHSSIVMTPDEAKVLMDDIKRFADTENDREEGRDD